MQKDKCWFKGHTTKQNIVAQPAHDAEGVNVCFDIEEEKTGVHHKEKEYKHRFTIHERGTMRQCSPTFKEESYKYYLGILKQIEQFYKDTDSAEKYKEYIEYDIKT